jgi:hypothetical protein
MDRNVASQSVPPLEILCYADFRFSSGLQLTVTLGQAESEQLARWLEVEASQVPFFVCDTLDNRRYVISAEHLATARIVCAPGCQDGSAPLHSEDDEHVQIHLVGTNVPLLVDVDVDEPDAEEAEYLGPLHEFCWEARNCGHLALKRLRLVDDDGDIVWIQQKHLIAAVVPRWLCGDAHGRHDEER